jgi:alpha-glucosidase
LHVQDAGFHPRADEWWREAVVYQVYPRSFADADGDGVGDLRGVTRRLDHLVDLGVDALWLSPIYPSPMRDNGYDVSDYQAVDPTFGALEDFDALLAAAHARGLRVVLDLVLSHSSDRHPWFLGSRSSREDRKRNWYVWRDGGRDGGPPNNWRSAFPHVGSAWTFDAATGQWYLHSHLAEQPDLNWEEPEVRAAAEAIMRFWLERGIDGFRVDAVARMGKDPDFTDEDPADVDAPRRQQDWPTVHEHVRFMRGVVDDFPGRLLLGELWLFDQARVAAYARRRDGLHVVHNMVFPSLPWRAESFGAAIDQYTELAGRDAWPSWFLNNHDWPRTVSRYADGAADRVMRARAGAMLVLTLRGTPFLYQGEELGLPDVALGADEQIDEQGRDAWRTPLPWAPPSQAGAGAGFTTGTPWLRVGPAAETLAVSRQANDPKSTLSFYRRLLALRRERPSLRRGVDARHGAPGDVLVYERTLGNERTLVALNFGAVGTTVQLPDAFRETEPLLSTHLDRDRAPLAGRLELRADEGVVLG